MILVGGEKEVGVRDSGRDSQIDLFPYPTGSEIESEGTKGLGLANQTLLLSNKSTKRAKQFALLFE